MVYLIRKENGKTQILLQQRAGKDYNAEGLWEASAAGHVDPGESMTATAIRETKEEIDVKFSEKDIEFTTIIHSNQYEVPYYNGHFFVNKFSGKPRICEPNKCSNLRWYDLDKLPENFFADRREAIQNFIKKKGYSEIGWKD